MSDSDRGERPEAVGQGLAILASVILCCSIVAVLTFASVRFSTDRNERAEYYQAEADRNAKAICIGRERSLLAECVEEQRRASRDAYTDEQDLIAQQQMALWALWMFIVSAVTAGLTLWALWYVRGTLQATREALTDTGNATEAMVQANRIAETNAQRQSRAYLFVKSVTVDEPIDDSDSLTLLIEVQNAGNTPGEITQLSTSLIWLSQPPVELIDTNFEHLSEIHPGTPYQIPYRIPSEALDQCVHDGLFVCMGRIDYKDVFGAEHFVPCAFRSLELSKHTMESVETPCRLASFSMSEIDRAILERRRGQKTRKPT